MKKSFKKLLLLATLIPVTFTASAYDFEVDGIYYNVVSMPDMTAEITYSLDDKYTFETFSIPENVTFNGRTFKIIKVGNYAFDFCNSLTSVTIPGSVTSIGSYAFEYCI